MKTEVLHAKTETKLVLWEKFIDLNVNIKRENSLKISEIFNWTS